MPGNRGNKWPSLSPGNTRHISVTFLSRIQERTPCVRPYHGAAVNFTHHCSRFHCGEIIQERFSSSSAGMSSSITGLPFVNENLLPCGNEHVDGGFSNVARVALARHLASFTLQLVGCLSSCREGRGWSVPPPHKSLPYHYTFTCAATLRRTQ